MCNILSRGQLLMEALFSTAACHTGGANVVQAEKTLQKDALVAYLDGGFNVNAIVNQARSLCCQDFIEDVHAIQSLPSNCASLFNQKHPATPQEYARYEVVRNGD